MATEHTIYENKNSDETFAAFKASEKEIKEGDDMIVNFNIFNEEHKINVQDRFVVTKIIKEDGSDKIGYIGVSATGREILFEEHQIVKEKQEKGEDDLSLSNALLHQVVAAKKIESIEYDGTQKATKLTLDRDRMIDYQGIELYANTYRCTSCDQTYIMQCMIHIACPCCGIKYKYCDDMSV